MDSFGNRIRPLSARAAWPIFTRFCLRRSIAWQRTIANLVGLSLAQQHGWLGAASAEPSFAPTIRQQVLVAQPEFNQRRRVELATTLALAQLRQNLAR
jgi:hypothetical protein